MQLNQVQCSYHLRHQLSPVQLLQREAGSVTQGARRKAPNKPYLKQPAETALQLVQPAQQMLAPLLG